ncbi:MAG: prephenate dehydrogenase/arogenate dehydrogenase family protein [Spirochaetaceae bacterium]|nr:prephenate dehydrogenase/arogenate dehydrogenase family protein [Spirochaetaceae bacterium]
MKLLIIGTGKMGAWLTEELCWNHEVWAYDTDPIRMKYFMHVNRLSDLRDIDAVRPQMVINCVALGSTIDAFESVLPYIPGDCILSDIASVKTGLYDYYLKTGHPFVSTHPMFGPTNANFHDLHEENAIIIAESCKEGKEFFRQFYGGLNLRLFEYSFDEHDRTVAYSLATPFASTMVFAACMKKQEAPGTNFKKHMAIAKGLLSEDDRLLTEIMFNDYTIRQLELINSKLSYLTHIIRQKDYEEMSKFLEALRKNIAD